MTAERIGETRGRLRLFHCRRLLRLSYEHELSPVPQAGRLAGRLLLSRMPVYGGSGPARADVGAAHRDACADDECS